MYKANPQTVPNTIILNRDRPSSGRQLAHNTKALKHTNPAKLYACMLEIRTIGVHKAAIAIAKMGQLARRKRRKKRYH